MKEILGSDVSGLKAKRSLEMMEETRQTAPFVCFRIAIPLFLLFWFCDLIYVPEKRWAMLAVRLCIIPISFLVKWLTSKISTPIQAQILSLFIAISFAGLIDILIYLAGGVATPYYAGLNLVLIGVCAFLSFSSLFLIFAIIFVYSPYYILWCFGDPTFHMKLPQVFSFFIFGSAAISFGFRMLMERAKIWELASRLGLEQELAQRAEIIEKKTQEALLLQKEVARNEIFASIAAQVCHDIRSPLSALKVAAARIDSDPISTRALLSRAVMRVEQITSELANGSKLSEFIKTDFSSVSLENLISITNEIILEKRAMYSDRSNLKIYLDPVALLPNLEIKAEEEALKNILSNLIDNSVQAISDKGEVKILFDVQSEFLIIDIADNGKGIPPQVLSKLKQKGFTFGKKNGQGLGLYMANRDALNWGGEIQIQSQLGVGTKVTIKLRLNSQPPRQSSS